MTYTRESHIKSVKDVETFFHHIVSERKGNFHPDDMFEDYVSCECVDICENKGIFFFTGLEEPSRGSRNKYSISMAYNFII